MTAKYMVCYELKANKKKHYKWFMTLEEATAFLDSIGRDRGFIEKLSSVEGDGMSAKNATSLFVGQQVYHTVCPQGPAVLVTILEIASYRVYMTGTVRTVVYYQTPDGEEYSDPIDVFWRNTPMELPGEEN